ncbi:TPA: hypothetical protein HA265_07715 [Candidatus Woesearchaeota archaeon]|nr:hypothetical protein [Candidatus Woesearchaeota archaeon]
MRQMIILLMLSILLSGCAVTQPGVSPAEDRGLEVEHGEDHGDFSVDIRCEQMKLMSIKAIADLWGIDAEELLDAVTEEYGLKGFHTTDSLLDDLRDEVPFEPRGVKEIAERIKGVPLTVEEEKKIETLISACPNGEVNDPYPGKCGSYIDRDKDGLCDYGEPI